MTQYEWGEHKIRIQDIDGNPWFLAKDVCRVLDLDNVSRACDGLDDDEKLVSLLPIAGQGRNILFVSESGLYFSILRHALCLSMRKVGAYEGCCVAGG